MNVSDSASESGWRPTPGILQLVPPPPGQTPLQPQPAAFEPAGDPGEPVNRPADPSLSAETRRLQRELSEVSEEVEALQELLEELPSIFERKFRQRLSRVLHEQQQLEAANAGLWTQLKALAPGTEAEAGPMAPHGLLPPAGTPPEAIQDSGEPSSAVPG